MDAGPRLFDGHNDTLVHIFVPNEDHEYETRETEDGFEVELPPALSHERAKQFTYDVLERLYRIEAESAGTVRVVDTVADLETALNDEDTIAAVPHLEGAGAVAPNLANLDFLCVAPTRPREY